MHASICTMQKRIKAAKTWKITWQRCCIIFSHRKILSWEFYFVFWTHWMAKNSLREDRYFCINVKVSQACESYLYIPWHFGLNLSISYTKSALFGNNHRPKCISQSLHSHLRPYCFISTLYYVTIFPFAIFFLLNINSVQLRHLHHVTSPPPPLSLSHPKLGQHSSWPGDPAGPVWKCEYYKRCTVFFSCLTRLKGMILFLY